MENLQDVYAPLSTLKEISRGSKSHAKEKQKLLSRIEEIQTRILYLREKTFEMEQQYKAVSNEAQSSGMNTTTNNKGSTTTLPALFPSPPSASSSFSFPFPQRSNAHFSNITSTTNTLNIINATTGTPSKTPTSTITSIASNINSSSFSSSQKSNEETAKLAQQEEIALAKKRVAHLEEVMKAVRDISAQGEYEDVIRYTLDAAVKLVKADKYTLGLLNERRNIVEIFSITPNRNSNSTTITTDSMMTTNTSTKNYEDEGIVAADSGTTYGRVILTGKALEINDFYDNYEDAQFKSLGFTPETLLCIPIRNAHSAIVGVLQVILSKDHASKHEPLSSNFSSVDRKRLEFLSIVAGTAIWNLILSRERKTAQNRIEGLLNLHRNISMEAVSSNVLDQVLAVCHELVSTERIGLFMKVDGENELYIASAADVVKGEYVPITKGIVGLVARTGKTVITNNAYSHPMFDPTLDLKTGFVTKRILCVPVKSPEGNILAVLSAVNKVDNTDFSSEDAVFLNYTADAVGIALHKSALHHEVKTSQKLIEARLKLTTFISESSTDIAQFVDLIMEIGKDIMECDRFSLLLIDHFKKELWITPKIGGESIRTPMNRGISGLVATTGQIVCTRDAYKHELFDPSIDLKTGYRTTSVLCMPIFEDQKNNSKQPKVVAVAMCINKKEGANHIVAFNNTDKQVMERFCREVQFALGRLSLDISYYKVVSDSKKNTNNDNSSSSKPFKPSSVATTSDDGVSFTSSTSTSSTSTSSTSTSTSTNSSTSSTNATTISNTVIKDGGYSESDIISSIVQKYYGTNQTEANEIDSFASLVPLVLQKKKEDETIPFPREINFLSHNESWNQWDTNILNFQNAEMTLACGTIFRAYGFLDAFRITNEKFVAFINSVVSYYRPNSFHNFQHGFQVMFTMHIMIKQEGRKFFNGLEIFAMLIASLCHDIDHPGNTNEFELKTLSPMALTHNDDAVLERHHCRVTFIILNHKSAQILQHFDKQRFKKIRQWILFCILSTDMAKHFEKFKQLENMTRRQLLNEKRFLFMGILIHAADLSYATLPFQQSFLWNEKLLDEFQNQAKNEKEQNLSTDFFMQNLHHQKRRFLVSIHLNSYVVRPFWFSLTSLCPPLRFYTDSLDQNIGLYKKELIKIQEKEEKEGPIYLEKNIRRMSGGTGSGSGRFFSSTSTSTTGTTNASQERISRAHSFSIKDSIGGGRIEEKSKRE